jgi:LacI family transcriptional regulator
MARPTLRQIAAACGVNVSTVSRALNGSTRIPQETQSKILQTARKLGWAPNPLAAAYMAHLRSTHPPSYKATLGFLVDVPGVEDWAAMPGHIQLHFASAQARAASYGYMLHPINLADEGMTLRRADQAFRNRNVPGVLLSSFRPDHVLRHFGWRHYSSVLLGSPVRHPILHRVASNTHHGFHMVINHAFALGYRRVGVVISEQYDSQTDHGVMFPVAYAQRRLQPDQSLDALVLERSDDTAKPLVREWLERLRPEVLIGTDIARQTLADMDWRVPDDIAFISVDRSPSFPEYAGFNQRHELFGRVGIDLLVSQLNANQRDIPQDPILNLVQGTWVDGPSAPVRASVRVDRQPSTPGPR